HPDLERAAAEASERGRRREVAPLEERVDALLAQEPADPLRLELVPDEHDRDRVAHGLAGPRSIAATRSTARIAAAGVSMPPRVDDRAVRILLVLALVCAAAAAGGRIATAAAPRATPVPILEYHVIGDPPPGAPYPALYVAEADFRAQLTWLERH